MRTLMLALLLLASALTVWFVVDVGGDHGYDEGSPDDPSRSPATSEDPTEPAGPPQAPTIRLDPLERIAVWREADRARAAFEEPDWSTIEVPPGLDWRNPGVLLAWVAGHLAVRGRSEADLEALRTLDLEHLPYEHGLLLPHALHLWEREGRMEVRVVYPFVFVRRVPEGEGEPKGGQKADWPPID